MSKQPSELNIPLITAMTARFSLKELIDAYRLGREIRVYYYPDGQAGARRHWTGVPDADMLTTARTLLGAALGRTAPESRVIMGSETQSAPDNRSTVGDILEGYERISTYKWTTDFFTRKPIPPQSIVWRDLHTGKISVRHPFKKDAV